MTLPQTARSVAKSRQPDQTHRYASEIDRHIAGRIVERRVTLGLTLIDLGERCGTVTYQQLAKYESGKNRVSAGRLYELSKALEVPVGWFFDGIEP